MSMRQVFGFTLSFWVAVGLYLPTVVLADEPFSLPGYPRNCSCSPQQCGYYCYGNTQSILGSYGPLECVYISGEPNEMPAYPACDLDKDWGQQGPKIIVRSCCGTSPAELELFFSQDAIAYWYNCDGPGSPTGNPEYDYSRYVQWSHALVRVDYDPKIFVVDLESGGTIVNKPGKSAPPLCLWVSGYAQLQFKLRSTSCEALRRARNAEITVTGQIFRSVRSFCWSNWGYCGAGWGDACREECEANGEPKFKGELSEAINLGTVGVQFIGMNPCWD